MAIEDLRPNTYVPADHCVARRQAIQQICAIAHKYANELFPDEPGDAEFARQLVAELEKASAKPAPTLTQGSLV